MASDSDWLNELSRRTGASVEQSDLERLGQTNEGDDRQRLMDAYESQYARRGASGKTGSGTDSSEMTRLGYGSGRDETADDINRGRGGVADSWLGGSGGSGGWGGGGGGNGASSMFPDWYRQMMERSEQRGIASQAENKARGDALFTDLRGRAGQSLNVDRNDPGIRQQADAFSANQRRAQRNFISDTAEQAGSFANIQGERRMAAERYGAKTGEFEAGLVGEEKAARRLEITQALQMSAGMLSGDQIREMQMELAKMDAGGREAGLGVQVRGQDQNYDLGMRGADLGQRRLGLEDWNAQMQWRDAGWL